MIFSPVGRMPASARAYLTGIIILMLVLVAVHFSIQVKGQQQAQQWVTSWAKQYHGHVGEVRLQMLRGALLIRDVTWKSNDNTTLSFYAPSILVRGNVSDSIENVDIHEVLLKNPYLTVSKQVFQQITQQQKPLSTWLPWAMLLDNVKHVEAQNLELVIQARAHEGLPLQDVRLHNANFSSKPKQHDWQLSGTLWDGTIALHSHIHDMHMTYTHIDARSVSHRLGLSDIQGHLSGRMHLQKKQIKGNIQWQHITKKNKQHVLEGTLVFQGSLDKQGWQADVETLNWPLQMFSKAAPVLYDRKLISAYLHGLLHIKSRNTGWSINMPKGQLSQLNYNTTSAANWQLARIDFKRLKLVWPERMLTVADMNIQQGRWIVNSKASPLPSLASTWQLELPSVHFDSITFADQLKDIWLPDMQGKLSLHKQKLHIQAGSDNQQMGQWQITAQGLLPQTIHDTGSHLGLNIHAEHVPLLRFRDALPHIFAQDARLNGQVSLDLSGKWNQQGWQLQGDMQAQDIMWNRGAWLWRAEHMQLQNIRFSSTDMPTVDMLQIDNWAGQSSLTPWSKVSNSIIPEEPQYALTIDGWTLQHIHMGYGKFSLGQADAVWFESDHINFNTIADKQIMDVKIQGLLADGRFAFKGTWFPWGTSPWLSLHASLKDALPFVAAPWLHVSGLPTITRGRLSANINIKQVADKPHYYQGDMHLQLKHGQLQNGIFSNNLFSEYTAYDANALFDRINNGDIHVDIPLQGNWVYTPLNSLELGKGLLMALASKATTKATEQQRSIVALSNIRLHDSHDGHTDSLKHNERVRLRKVLHMLQNEKTWLIELQPQLGQEALDDELRQRVYATQRQIEAFLVSRGIPAARIFPIWPDESHRQGQSTGIFIQAVK